MNATTDPRLRSFIDVPADHDFPIQNLPYGVFRPPGGPPRVGVRIGDFVLDLSVLEREGTFADATGDGPWFAQPALNAFMSRGPAVWHTVRVRVSTLLRHDNPTLRDDTPLRDRCLRPIGEVEMCLPARIGDYTDFYSSRHHAFNVGSMFRDPADALPPNYLWLPIGYHGRASSVVLSGTPIHRPCGQTRAASAAVPKFGPCRALDFELEMGFFAGGPPTRVGERVPIERAAEHIFGLVLVNDWSARDIQQWEYMPLGPFLAKNFATTISPWVVPLEALEPFRCAGPVQAPEPLAYLRPPPAPEGGRGWSYDIRLEVALQTPELGEPHVICRSNYRHLYWSMIQQVAHHTVSGCNLRPGDLMASGTISGPTPESCGSMLELAWQGTRPLTLPSGQQRRFIEDGDTVLMRGWCEGDGYRVGFGECTGRVLSALQPDVDMTKR